MAYRVNENCIGCGMCVSICPDVFTLGTDGYAHAAAQPGDESTRELADQAAENCPTSAIEKE